MKSDTFQLTAIKAKAIHEVKQFVGICLYLAFFFCSVTTYKIFLLKQFDHLYFDYSFVLINAFVFAKVILVGEYAHLGKKLEDQPLILSSIYKALIFSLLIMEFHYFEEGIKRFLHGESVIGTFYEMSPDLLIARSLVVLSTFIPFFAFRELRRVLGEDKFYDLFFHHGSNRSKVTPPTIHKPRPSTFG